MAPVVLFVQIFASSSAVRLLLAVHILRSHPMLGGRVSGRGAGLLGFSDDPLRLLVVWWGLLVVSSWFLRGLLVVGCRGRPGRSGDPSRHGALSAFGDRHWHTSWDFLD